MSIIKATYFDKALEWVAKKPTSSVKAQLEGYDPPQIFKNKNSGEGVQADISFESHAGARSYTDIALKTDEPQELVTRWKLLSIMAGMKNGKLYLLTPKGHKMFTQKLVDTYNINATIHSI